MRSAEKCSGLLFLALFVFTGIALRAQIGTETKRLSFSTNLLQIPINEISLNIDYGFRTRQSVGINGGYIFSVRSASGIPYLKNDDFPGSVYQGFALRLNYKYYFENSFGQFICFQGIYKNQGYTDRLFVDAGYLSNTFVHYVRNEKAWVGGVDIFSGNTITKSHSGIFIEMFYGLGVRYRVRNYTTTYSQLENNTGTGAPASQDPHYPTGDFTKTQIYPTIILGFKMGYSKLFKKKAS